jgi:hypothetical protein
MAKRVWSKVCGRWLRGAKAEGRYCDKSPLRRCTCSSLEVERVVSFDLSKIRINCRLVVYTPAAAFSIITLYSHTLQFG